MTVDQKDEKTLIGPSPTLTGSNLNGANDFNTNPFGGIFEHSATGTDAIQHQLSDIPDSAVVTLDFGNLDSGSNNKKYLKYGLGALAFMTILFGATLVYSLFSKRAS